MARFSSTALSRLSLAAAASVLAMIGRSGFGIASPTDDRGGGEVAAGGAPLCGEPFVSICEADMAPPEGNGVVNVDDLLVVINHWGEDGTATGLRPPGDCAPLPGGDCEVDVDDLINIISAWSNCPAGACCLPDTGCVQLTYSACGQQGGTFVGGENCFNQSVCPMVMPNDDCAAASTTLGTWYNLNATTDGPAGEPGNTCESLIARDLWYRTTITCDGVTEFRFGSNAGSAVTVLLAVYDGWSCPPGALLGCVDEVSGDGRLILDLPVGQQVTLRVGTTAASGPGECFVSKECITIVNDDCAGATTTLGNWNNQYATNDGPPGEPGNTCESLMVRDLWYRHTVTCANLTRFRAFGNVTDKVMAVYDGWGCPPGPLLGCVRGTGSQFITLDLKVGHQVLIRVGTTAESASTEGGVSQTCVTAP